MSGIIKVFLLLAVMVCISTAQHGCLCIRNVNRIGSTYGIKSIQIHPETIFCQKVQIIVTMNSGAKYCLDPEMTATQKLIAFIKKREASPTARPTELTSTPY